MIVRVTQTFRDKDDYSTIYRAGEERVFNDNRAQHLISLGLAESISIAQEEAQTPTRKRGRKSTKQVTNENL